MVTLANSPVLIDQLLDKLSTDDQFRANLLADPLNVLHDMGLEAEPEDIPALRQLPSKAVIQANRALIQSKMNTQQTLVYFWLSGKA